MNDEIVNAFDDQSFTKSIAILTRKKYSPGDVQLQHIPVKQNVEKVEANRLRNGNIPDTLISSDIQEIVNLGGIATENYEGEIYKKFLKYLL